MARHDLDPEERDQQTLTVEQIVECPSCGLDIDVVFAAPEGVYEAQDLTETPSQEVECPRCATVFQAEFEGWRFFDEAG